MNDLNIAPLQEGTALTLQLSGRLDTVSAPQLEQYLDAHLAGVQDLTLDFAQLDYLSSAGLRVLLKAQKQMNRQGQLVLCHVQPVVQEVLEITGFADILQIEP